MYGVVHRLLPLWVFLSGVLSSSSSRGRSLYREKKVAVLDIAPVVLLLAPGFV